VLTLDTTIVGWRPRGLAHRDRFAGQERFNGSEVRAPQQYGVRGHTVAFAQYQQVIAHDVAAGDGRSSGYAIKQVRIRARAAAAMTTTITSAPPAL